MLDRKFIVENAELIRTNCTNRGVKCDLDRLLELEASRRQVLAQVEQLNRQANEVAGSIGKTKDAAEREARKEEGRLRDQKENAQREHDELDAQANAIQQTIPNLTHPTAGWAG